MATDPSQPSISVVIVAWNSASELRRTLPALVGELGEADELVVVDNDSSDDTVAVVRELAPGAKLLETGENSGFAAGANAGAAAASGDLLVLLNPDAVPEPGWGAAIRRPHREEGRGWAAWMGLVTAEGGRVVNSVGGVLHFTGIAWAGRAGDVAPQDLTPGEVPFLSGACLAIPRLTWERTGGFSERYFLYHEDVDLSLRLRLAGGAIGIEPSAVVDHDYEFGGAGKYRYLERNRWATILRDYPAPLLALVTPALLATELALMAASLAGGWGRQKWDANFDVLRNLGPTLRERRLIQDARTTSAGEFAAFLTPDLDSAYLGRAATFPPLRWTLRAYWRVVRLLLRAPDRSALPEG